MDEREIQQLIDSEIDRLRSEMQDAIDAAISDVQESIDNLLCRIQQLERGENE